MKCEICGKEILRDSQCINYKYYHNDCIEKLQQGIKHLDEVDCKLRRKIGQLEYNWNKLKEYIKTEIPEDVFIDTEWFVSILDKMQELEESDNQ